MKYTVNTIKHRERKPNISTSIVREGAFDLVFGDFTYNLSYIYVDLPLPNKDQIEVDRQLKFMVNDKLELMVIIPSMYDNMYDIFIENDKLNIIRRNGTI